MVLSVYRRNGNLEEVVLALIYYCSIYLKAVWPKEFAGFQMVAYRNLMGCLTRNGALGLKVGVVVTLEGVKGAPLLRILPGRSRDQGLDGKYLQEYLC